MSGQNKRRSNSGFQRAWDRIKKEGQGLASAMMKGGSFANAEEAEKSAKRSRRIKED